MSEVVVEAAALTGAAARALIRAGEWRRPTAGLADGYVQANLAVLPREYAYEFLRFCAFNPRPCPVLDVTDAGSPAAARAAPGSDLRVDLPRYRVYRHGELAEERDDLVGIWRDDLVGFLLGCSFTFEAALARAGVPLRHRECGCNVAMYRTNRACVAAGPFAGPLVVSMRPVRADLVARAVEVTARFPRAHGAPVHVGDPAALGVRDLAAPDYGDPLPIAPGEVPVFWACGVTPQAAVMASKPAFAIGHAPGSMAITDVRDNTFLVP